MSRPAPPALTVRYDGSTRSFAPGNDVVVGRDLRADVRIAHPLISRAHLVLRFDQGRWVAIDNGSLNGMYVNNRRMPSVDIQDGQRLNIGNPDGPQLTFRGRPAPGRRGSDADPIGVDQPGARRRHLLAHAGAGAPAPPVPATGVTAADAPVERAAFENGSTRIPVRAATTAVPVGAATGRAQRPAAVCPRRRCGNPRYRSRYRNRHSSR